MDGPQHFNDGKIVFSPTKKALFWDCQFGSDWLISAMFLVRQEKIERGNVLEIFRETRAPNTMLAAKCFQARKDCFWGCCGFCF